MFIELHAYETGQPLLIAVSHIIRVVPEDEGTRVHFSGSDDSFVYVRESYEDVQSLLLKADAKVKKATGPMKISDEVLEKARS